MESSPPKYNGARYTVKVTPKKFGSTAPSCSTCGKSVYAAEQVLGPGGRPYHKLCLKCASCSKLLDPNHLQDRDYDPYCKPCYARLFGPKGVGFGNAMTGEYEVRGSPRASPVREREKWTPKASPASGLSRSPGSFDVASRTNGGTRTARDASPPSLDSLSLSDEPRSGSPTRTSALRPDPRLSQRSNSLVPDDPTADEDDDDWNPPSLPNPIFSVVARPKTSDPPISATSSGRASPIASAGAPRESSSRSSSPRPFSPPPSFAARPPSPLKHSSLPPTSASAASLDDPIANAAAPPSPARRQLPLTPVKNTASLPSSSLPASPSTSFRGSPSTGFGSKGVGPGPVQCPRCGTTVYFAEQVMAAGRKWHKRCLRCDKCNKALDAGNINEREGTPYCKKCYSDAFGTEAQGFVLRAGFSSR